MAYNESMTSAGEATVGDESDIVPEPMRPAATPKLSDYAAEPNNTFFS